ncbi:FAD-dependent oxidoreductase [Hyphomicrobium sp. D-2]|uniref:phytoene desaturase family protein n=1 Tax=Hyphomicrobium sp. D-2 TaxID=3041621 RepID=UPI0024554BB6|nr:FAD-dependent oxidoreductase [Hyphomicrobium sp. D-2]MDH4983690.1 NAD(P)-binding protein [Hyphomicrobium sp. D-2]
MTDAVGVEARTPPSMGNQYDAIVIGAGLGGLTAAATLAKAGCSTLLIERNYGVGGAASTYKSGDVTIEASLHETTDPHSPIDPKHAALSALDVTDKVQWIGAGSVYDVRGGPIGPSFILPTGMDAARAALVDRFPSLRVGINDLLGDMERITTSVGTLSQHQGALSDPLLTIDALKDLGPAVTGWRRSLSQQLQRTLGDNEAAKCAVAANMLFWHDDPDSLWWILFALAQGGNIATGIRFVQGGSQRLSNALAKSMRGAGGQLLLRRTVTQILFDESGAPVGVVHEGKQGGDPVEVRAPIVVSGIAPSIMAPMLPNGTRERFMAPYASSPLSISLFTATFGMAQPPTHFGLGSYTTMLLPEWMRSLADYRRSADLLAAMPGEAMPPLAIANYSAIDSGLGGPPYTLSVIGVDRMANWQGLDAESYEAKRAAWKQAIIQSLDRTYPGFASAVETSVFNTAASINSYLGAPQGAVYGFAPLPPSTPIWHGPARTPRTAIDRLFLSSAYGGYGGYSGAIWSGATAARQALAALSVSKK